MKEAPDARGARWPSVHWGYSLILPVALTLVLLTVMFAEPHRDLTEIRVVSAVSGDAMPGALVTVGDHVYLADEDGGVRVARPPRDTRIGARVDGFTQIDMPSRSSERAQVIQMQPALVSGIVKDATTGAPVDGADVSLFDGAGQPVASLRTDSRGAYIFKTVPEHSTVRVRAEGYIADEIQVGARHQVDVMLTPLTPVEVLGARVSTQVFQIAMALAETDEGGE